MADDIQQTNNSPNSPTTTPPTASDDSSSKPSSKKPAGDQPNPLDVLEKLLDDIDKGKGGGNAKDLLKKGSAGPSKPAGPTPEEIAAKELEKQRLEYEQKKAEQKIVDDKMIEEQRKALVSEMETGEANVARARQDEEKKQEHEEKQQSGDGFEVVQLNHTKI